MTARKTPDSAPDPDGYEWVDVGPSDTSPAVFGMFGTTTEAVDTPIDPDPKPIIPIVDQ